MMHMDEAWSTRELGSLSGKTALVTGANSGIGFYTALELGRAGARVLVACRNPDRASAALERLRGEAPGAEFQLEALDLADLSSVRALATRLLERGQALDMLINNAGVMATPQRGLTRDGFELQFATNHLGHFALTGLLMPALSRSKAARVVTVSSFGALFGKMEFTNLQSERRYVPLFAYARTKLANLLFMLELGRRAPWLTSVAAHPGSTQSNLQKHAFKWSAKVMGQPAASGALPSLRAATAAVPSGTYFGPRDLFHMRGAPVQVSLPRRARDAEAARKLWEVSEQLTRVRYTADEGPTPDPLAPAPPETAPKPDKSLGPL
jgi:NAD(P)-dependent dehydrogenase (short-subunit alcohol dehydrogenase family)